jgi:hypothetical protein
LRNLAWVEWNIGDYSAAQVHAKEAQRLATISADLYTEAEALRIEAIDWEITQKPCLSALEQENS